MATSYPYLNDKKHGILYFQKAFYTMSQMNHIDNKFKNHLDRAPRVLFSDNYRDYQRKSHEKRMDTGPQSKVLAPYDKSFGFGIPTRFNNSYSCGFLDNEHNFNTLIRNLFTKLDKHLRNGGDVIVPAPLDSELKNKKHKQTYYQYGNKQVIFHNIGTAVLDKKRLLFIQQQIDNLKVIAADWKVIRGEVNYYNYKLYDRYTELTQVQHQHHKYEEVPLSNTKPSASNKTERGCLVLQTSWFDSKQLQCIDAEYKSNYKSAPRFLFGDNDQDNGRQSYQKRQMFGGQAAVVGKYDRSIGYGIVTTFFSARTPPIYEYKRKMDQQFKPLADHLRNGYDVIVPYPTSKDINSNRNRYYGYGSNKQVIFHNLGTGIASLSMEHIRYIQQKIDELKNIARKVDYAMYYNYDPQTNRLLKRKRPPHHYSAPKEPSHKGPQNKDTSLSSDSQYSQPEWICNICGAISQSYQTHCNQCHTRKGTVKEVVQKESQFQPQFSTNTNEMQKLRKQIAELQTSNISLKQKLNEQMSDVQVANVQVQQMKMQKQEKDRKSNASDEEIRNLKKHVTELQKELKAKEDESADWRKLQQERDDALNQLKGYQSKWAQCMGEIDELKQQNKKLLEAQANNEIELKSQEDEQRTPESKKMEDLQRERDDALNDIANLKKQNQELLHNTQQTESCKHHKTVIDSLAREIEALQKEKAEIMESVLNTAQRGDGVNHGTNDNDDEKGWNIVQKSDEHGDKSDVTDQCSKYKEQDIGDNHCANTTGGGVDIGNDDDDDDDDDDSDMEQS